ncbi:MAG: ion channel [Marinifilaceae bacterium]
MGNKLSVCLYNYRFELLFISFAIIFVINIIFPEDIYGGDGQAIYVLLQFIAGVNLFRNKRKSLFKLFIIVGAVTLLGRILGVINVLDINRFISVFYILFFGAIIIELFRQLFHAEIVNREIVIAAICGLLLIGYTSYFVFTAVEFFQPGSFSGLSEGPGKFKDLFYYSYVTLMTIGYGDISPVTWVAKNATLMCALTGYIYSLVVIAIIVGRFSATIKK